MSIILIIFIIAFSVILCVIEIPKMVKTKLHRELVAFCIILFLGDVIAVLKSLNIDIPNPADLIATIYSPITKLMKDILE